MASIFATPGSPEWWSLGQHGGPDAALDRESESMNSSSMLDEHNPAAADHQVTTFTPALPYSPHAAFLSAAATGGTQQMVDVLERHPDAIFTQNERGMTAAHLAVWEGHIVSLSVLTNRDRRCLEIADKFGQQPVHLAAWKGDVQILRFFHNLNPNILAERTPQGSTAAHLAAKGCRPATISLFCQLPGEQAPWLLQQRDFFGRLPVELCQNKDEVTLVNQAMQQEFSVEVIMHGMQTL